MKQTIDNILFDKYLRMKRRRKRFVFIIQLALFISIIVLWELLSRYYIIDPLIFSSPTKVSKLFLEKFIDGTLFYHLRYTVFETILGFILGTIGGIIIASLLWSSKRLADIVDPYLVVFNAMPKVALGPM